ncbi:TonB-dependent receptor [Flavobacterium hydrophilum]|uniref:TonB-dependent siderophore receptor n=1 Tax=Flavobacterium hydrophilum TaxID=2211445 RepID=A0A2V4C5B4_9FLAO|nr:TonB-dependent receptor [Flavobacterium hydrophilum]PXY46531.1 TonB-dependent siderophore receptor [Flavobacterium hydrophilum]
MKNSNKRILCFLVTIYSFLLFSFSAVAQQNHGKIKGTVTTSDGDAAAGVNIILKNSKYGTITNEDGVFEFNRIKPNTYTLQVSLTGYETLEQEVSVSENETTSLNLQLKVSNKELKEVVINNGKANKFADRETTYVSRLPLKNLENSQVYNTVSKDLIKEQLVTDMSQAHRNIPGAIPGAAGGGSVGIVSRGFTSYQSLRNGMNSAAIGPEDPINIERIEAIKGPVGTLFSNISTSLGGVLNYVTKKPYETIGGEISYTTGTYQLNRLTADVNAPLDKEKTLLFRATASYQTRNGYANGDGALWANSYSFSPKLTFKVSPDLTLNIDAEIVSQKYNATYVYNIGAGVTAKSLKDLLPYDKSLSSNGLANRNFMNNVNATADYKISDEWTSQTSYMFSEGHYPKQYLYSVATFTSNTSVNRQVALWIPDNKFGQMQLQQNFVGDFKIGNLRNRIIAGIDWSQYYYGLNRPTVLSDGYKDTVDLTKPIPEISQAKIEAANSLLTYNYRSSKLDQYSAYVSDVLNITNNLNVMASLRITRAINSGVYSQNTGLTTGNYNQTQFSPKLGIVYEVLKDKISLFTNYNNGFINVAPAPTGPSGNITVLKPQQANQLEGGLKLNLFNGKLSSTLSYYDIQVTNATYADPANAAYTIQNGTQRSKGFEADIIANPIAGLNIVAGYGFNENIYTKNSTALQGKFSTFAPKNIANLWISYKIMNGKLSGLGLGAGGNYVSDSWYNTTNTFIFNGYTVANASIFYSAQKYILNLKLNNITNEQYYIVGTGTPQMLKNITVGFTYKF